MDSPLFYDKLSFKNLQVRIIIPDNFCCVFTLLIILLGSWTIENRKAQHFLGMVRAGEFCIEF